MTLFILQNIKGGVVKNVLYTYNESGLGPGAVKV